MKDDERLDVYIDVDGVINAVCRRAHPEWEWGDISVVDVAGFPIHYSPALVDELNRLADLPNVTMHWLTTWENDAATKLCPALGINGADWTVLGREQHAAETDAAWWKLTALRDYFSGRNTRAVWIDDDIPYDEPAREWIESLGGRLIAVTPRTYLGLTPAHMKAILTIAAAPAEAVTL